MSFSLCATLAVTLGVSSPVTIQIFPFYSNLLTHQSLALAPLTRVLRKYLWNEQNLSLFTLASPLKECHQLHSCPGLTGRHAAPLCSAGQPETEP